MNGAQGFLNLNNETLQPDTPIKGTRKPVQPLIAIAINHKSVATAPSHVAECGAKFNHLHPPGHSLDISNRKSPHTWFTNFHVVELLVQPKQDILVRQPISHPQRSCFVRDGTFCTPFRSGRVGRGRTWQGLLSLYLLRWHRGGHLAGDQITSGPQVGLVAT